MAANTRIVDQTGLKTGQALTIILLLIGFITNFWPLVTFVAIAQLLGALAVPFTPYRLFYQTVIKPSGLVKPRPELDNPEPHRFAMLVGSLFNGVATLAILAGAAPLGWGLVWVVIALANLNFWISFCLGCWMYYQFNMLGVPGFTQSPVN